MIGVFCSKEKRLSFLDSFFQGQITFEPVKYSNQLTGICAYGQDSSVNSGKDLAMRKGIPFYLIKRGLSNQLLDDNQFFEHDFSFIIQQEQVGSDALLEKLIETIQIEPTLLDKAKFVFDKISINSSAKTSKYIVLVDEPKDRLQSKKDTFKNMLEIAKKENSEKNLRIISTFEEDGYLQDLIGNDGIEIITSKSLAEDLIRTAKRVMVIDSHEGFKALLYKRNIQCFGTPFYSNFVSSMDESNKIDKSKSKSLLEVFTIYFYHYEKQVNPLTGMPTDLNDIFQIIDNKRHRTKPIIQEKIYCFGIQPWKRGFVRPFVKNNYNSIYFPKSVSEIEDVFDQESSLLVWGHKEPEDVKEFAEKWNKPIMRIEDGFVRSVGLGTNVTLPWSLALDRKGIYYNPQEVSELEEILNYQIFTKNMLNDAMKIRKKIVDNQLTKYNSEPIEKLDLSTRGKKVILVPGQVEDDASIRYGCKDIKSNTDLLNCVRDQNPNAYIIYKPHPDIVSRNRKGEVTSDYISDACDHIEVEASIISCINFADEVHTMTSLTGFDALLRGKKVYTYGSPFYSGWGLTHDRHQVSRRQRTLTIDELIVGALLVYPRYFDWENKIRVSSATVIDKLIYKRNLFFENGVPKTKIKLPNRLKKLGFLLKEIIDNH